MTEQIDPARPGRKRSEQARQAILAAALELTAEAGYARLTIDGIAARSGTGKQTIYRWWPSKDDVLRALMARAQIDDAFGQRFRTAFLQRRRDALAVILDRAQARGELPAGLSPGTITDIVFGVIWYRMLATRQSLDNKLADELTTALAGPPSGCAQASEHAS